MTHTEPIAKIKTSELSEALAGTGATKEERMGAITSAIARGDLTLDGSFVIHPGKQTIEEFILSTVAGSNVTVDDYRNYWLRQISLAVRNIQFVDSNLQA